MIGDRFYKNNFNAHAYAEEVMWCNNNNATIIDKGEYYEVVASPPPPQPTKEEQLEKLDTQLAKDKQELAGYYMDAIFADDLEQQTELKEEMSSVLAKYDEDYEAILGGE